MKERRRLLALWLVASLLALAGVGLWGCGTPKAPSEPPGIVGAIQDIQQSGDDWSILVIGGTQAAGAVSDKALCRITKDTTVVDAAGTEIGPEELTKGSTVAVWFTGAIAESYPVQGTAAYVQVRSSGQ